jgi:hypothetical protein
MRRTIGTIGATLAVAAAFAAAATPSATPAATPATTACQGPGYYNCNYPAPRADREAHVPIIFAL